MTRVRVAAVTMIVVALVAASGDPYQKGTVAMSLRLRNEFLMTSARMFVTAPVFGVGIGRYRLMIIVICGLLTLGLQLVLARTRFGSRLRAAVEEE